MTSSEDFVINCIYQQIWGLFEPSGELAQEYLRIRYMQFIEIETSHLHSTPVCRSACVDIKLIGQPDHAGRKSHIYLVLGSGAGFKGYLQSA